MDFKLREDFNASFNIVAPWATKAELEEVLPTYVKGFFDGKNSEWAYRMNVHAIKLDFAEYINGYYVVVMHLDDADTEAKVKLNMWNGCIPSMHYNCYWWIGIFELKANKIKNGWFAYSHLGCRNLDLLLVHKIRPWISSHPLPDTSPKQLTINF